MIMDREVIDTTHSSSLSILADHHNQLLQQSIQAKAQQLAAKQVEIDEHQDRIQMIQQHHTIIQDELNTIQRLLFIHHTHQSNEQSHLDLHRLQLNRLHTLITNLDKQALQVSERKQTFQIEIDQLQQHISNIHHQTSIDQDHLQIIIDQMNQRDDEAFALIKYSQQDHRRINELIHQQQQHSLRSSQLQRLLQEEILDSTALEQQLDKLAHTFRRSFKQREEMIDRWRRLLQQMQNKDHRIDLQAMELLQLNKQNRINQNQLKEQQLFFQQEQHNNHLRQKLLDSTQSKIITLNNKQINTHQHNQQLQTQMQSLKTCLRNEHNQLQHQRTHINNIQSNILLKQQQLTQMRESHQQLIEQKQSLLHEHFSSSDKQRKRDQLIDIDQKHHKLMHDHCQQLSHQLFLVQTQLKTLHQQQEQHHTQQHIAIKQLQHQQQQLDHLDQQLFKQQELTDHQDFLKQSLERQINRINNQHRHQTMTTNSGQNSDTPSADLHLRIEQLKKDLLERSNHLNQIQTQMKLLHNDLRSIKDRLDHLNQHQTHHREDLFQLDLAIHFNEKQINTLNNQRQNDLVEQNLVDLEVKRLKDLLTRSTQIILNLEQQHIDLYKSMEERRLQVQASLHLFRVRLNDEQTKRSTSATQLALLIIRVNKLKHRYQSLTSSSSSPTPTDQDDQQQIVRIQTQQIFRSAQIREDLLSQGDQLETLLIKAERELRALENTLQLLQSNNQQIKNNSSKLHPTNAQIQEMQQLEQHLQTIIEQLHQRQQLLTHSLQQHKDKHSRSLSELNLLQDQLQQTTLGIADKCHRQVQLEDQLEEYRLKIHRADQLIKHFQQINRVQRKRDEREEEELDIDIRVRGQSNEKIEQQIISFCRSTGDERVIDALEQLSADLGVKMVVRSSASGCSSRRDDREEEKEKKGGSSVPSSVCSSVVNVSIDGVRRSTTSQSRRSSASSSCSSTVSKRTS